MKINIKTNLSFLFFSLLLSLNIFAQASKKAENDTKEWRYEVEAVNTGVTGTYLVKVWTYSKKASVAIEQAKKNAVHGIIFKGITGHEGVSGQKPITTNPNIEQEKKDFFDPFFADGGKYLKFVASTNDGAIASEDIMKIGKEYKVGVVLSVNVTLLRKDLESAGIIESLGSGW